MSRVVLSALVAAACAGGVAPRRGPPAAGSPAATTGRPTGSALERGWEHLRASRHADAEADFRRALAAGTAEARLGLARVLLETGRALEAATTAADTVGADPAVTLAMIATRGAALRRLGKVEEAQALLTSAAGDPEAAAVRLLLAEVMLDQGRKKDAEAVLMTFVEQYNDGKVDAKDGKALARVGRAAFLLGSPRDANDAFNEAENAGEADAETLLWRAELFLEGYDPGHAGEVVGEVLERAPRHPTALARMAQVKLASNLDFEAAEALARKALAVDPGLPLARFVLGGVALRDMDLGRADAAIDEGLAASPRDLELLSLRAAVRFLADDRPGFDRAKADVLAKNPRYSRLYQIIGEYAEWEHRYAEIVTMMREALLADADDAKVRAQLGFNLIRSGMEAEGVAALSRAFAADPFNVRVFNTLNLYEKEIPAHYESATAGSTFTFRYGKEERPVLERYVPALMERAWAVLTKKYAFTPEIPVGVELYPVREHFAVRTSGLPQTFIQGVCFGRTLAAVSPKTERFNIGMTLWHELSHVFHIQLSKSRVPRWFTEGLAEYETLVARPEWRRELDTELFAALEGGRVPAVADLNRTFSHAEDMEDMATAYYASTQVVVFIAEQWGMPAVRRMLVLWGEGKRTPEVIEEALGVPPAELDRRFRAFASERLSRYRGQFFPPTRPGSVETARAVVKASPRDGEAQARLALSLMGTGEEAAAREAVDRALALEPKLGLALWLRAQLAKMSDDPAAARAALEAMIAAGHDGFAVRSALADVVKEPAARRAALEAASGFDPTEAAPLRALAELANQGHDVAGELSALRRLVRIEENDGDAYRRLLSLLLAGQEPEEARRVGEAAIYVDVESVEVHRLYAEALLATSAKKEALFELESAVRAAGAPTELALAHERLAALLDAAGDRAGAAAHRKTAADLRRQERTGPI